MADDDSPRDEKPDEGDDSTEQSDSAQAADDSPRDEKPDEGNDSTEQSDAEPQDGAGGHSSGATGGGEAGHEKLARSMEKHADELEGRSQEVGEQISQTRDDWESKQASESVPGAVGEPDEST